MANRHSRNNFDGEVEDNRHFRDIVSGTIRPIVLSSFTVLTLVAVMRRPGKWLACPPLRGSRTAGSPPSGPRR
jgi:hypothetical protein